MAEVFTDAYWSSAYFNCETGSVYTVRMYYLGNRTVTATQTALSIPCLRRISAQTVWNCLRDVGLRVRRPYFDLILGRQDRRARVRWCNTVRNWTLKNWRRIWFTNESTFMFQHWDGNMRVYVRKNERFANNCVVDVDRFGGGCVIMQGAISFNQQMPPVLVPAI